MTSPHTENNRVAEDSRVVPALPASRQSSHGGSSTLIRRSTSTISSRQMPGALPSLFQEEIRIIASSGAEHSFAERAPEESVPQDAFPEFNPATSARALMDVLALKTSLVTVIPAHDNGVLHTDEVVKERELRALFAKALAWFLERESIKWDGAYLVLVGQEGSEDARTTHPGIPVNALWDMAAELDLCDVQNPDIVRDFDAFMYHAAKYVPRGYQRRTWVVMAFWCALCVAVMSGMYISWM